MLLDNKKIAYYTVCAYNENSGVYFKITGLLDAAKRIGYTTDLKMISCSRISEFLAFYLDIVKNDAKYIFLRDIHSWQMMLSYPFLLFCRFQGKILIDDIPTPCNAALTESEQNGTMSSFRSAISKVLLLIKGPVPYWFFNKIIQYGNESSYFSFGNKGRTIMLGNGIEKNRMKLRKKDYLNHQGVLHLLGVSNLQISHGYDRIIRAIIKWNTMQPAYKVVFHIVTGNASQAVLDSYLELVHNNHIEPYVFFEKQMNTEQLYSIFSACDLAVGSLGAYRVGLTHASPLKLREYCLAGMPFIYSCIDKDFPIDLPFCFYVSNDDSIDDIINVFSEFPKRRESFTDESIRQYAIDNLNYTKKLHELGF